MSLPEPVDLDALGGVINAVIQLAIRYREITGKPLGMTGEVGEFHAAKLLGWQAAEARQPGYDAVASDGRRVQIKARCILKDSRPGQRVGQIKLDHPWDTVALVLMDGDFRPFAIYEAARADIERELSRPGSKSEMSAAPGVGKFRAIAAMVWSSTT